MTDIDNKELLLKAIEDYDSYSACAKKILCIFLDLEVRNEVNINPTNLSKKLGVSRTAIYTSLKNLVRDKIVIQLSSTRFEINQDQLEQIVQAHYKKQRFLNS